MLLAATLLSNAWTVTDETALFLKWVNCYGDQIYRQDREFFEDPASKELVDRWDNLVEAEREEGRNRRPSRGRGQNRARAALRWTIRQPGARNNQNGKNQKRAMVRCILGFVRFQADELSRILVRLREEGGHD